MEFSIRWPITVTLFSPLSLIWTVSINPIPALSVEFLWRQYWMRLWIQPVIRAFYMLLWNGARCVVLEFIRITSETGACLDRCNINRYHYRLFISAMFPKVITLLPLPYCRRVTQNFQINHWLQSSPNFNPIKHILDMLHTSQNCLHLPNKYNKVIERYISTQRLNN